MNNYIKNGSYRADKVQFQDGVGCCIWTPFPEDPEHPEDDSMGICFDFPESDIDDIIELLEQLKTVPALPLSATDTGDDDED